MADNLNRPVPPENSTLLLVSTVRRTGRPLSSTATANGSHWSGVINVSIRVMPSASTTTPAFARPRPGGHWNHPKTPVASGSRSTTGDLSGYSYGHRPRGTHITPAQHT